MPSYYPVFVDIRGRRCLVFGGNYEGERKVRYLLDCGGDVTLFSPEHDTLAGLAGLASDGRSRGNAESTSRATSTGRGW